MSEIPEYLISIAKDMARTARENGLREASGVLKVSFNIAWSADVHWHWVVGRHDEESNNLKVWAHVETITQLAVKAKI